MQAIHPVFHASVLEPTLPNTNSNQVQLPPAPVVIDREPEFEISNILDSKIDKCYKACKLFVTCITPCYLQSSRTNSGLLTTTLMLSKRDSPRTCALHWSPALGHSCPWPTPLPSSHGEIPAWAWPCSTSLLHPTAHIFLCYLPSINIGGFPVYYSSSNINWVPPQ